jgi:hypothetical protein
VFRLIKFLLGLAALAGFVWFGANVPLGSRTLFQHLQAIGRTRETKDLLDGTRDTAKPLMDSVRRKAQEALNDKVAVLPADGGAPPAEEVSESDRQELKRVLGAEKTDHTHAGRPQHPAHGEHALH